ncbi:MAG TPA: multicopper oxidase domain-containing protein, partial [Acidimicrobiia bacterium]|nr:multicopper oxidase domain-containing protein [Acidimicrobiia bacterium]
MDAPTTRTIELKLGTTVFSIIAVMLALAALIVAAGDGGSTTVTQHGALASSDVPGDAVTVSLSEFTITPGTVQVEEGAVLKVVNKGGAPHTLAVEGEDIVTPELNPGESAGLDVADLGKGTYTLSCTISGHKDAGMKGKLKIVAAGTVDHSAHAQMAADEMDELMAKATVAFATGQAKTKGLGAQPLEPTIAADGAKVFDITASEIDWEVEPGRLVKAMAYNGTVPGPTLKVNDGDLLRVVLHNQMTQSTTIHWHGLKTPNSMDGVPDITQPPVKPGQSFTYEFVARGPAVGMYHSHHNAQVQGPNGLAGTILVGDLPLPAGVSIAKEVPMMLNDAGTIGLSLNGKSFPATAPVPVKQGEWFLVHYL